MIQVRLHDKPWWILSANKYEWKEATNVATPKNPTMTETSNLIRAKTSKLCHLITFKFRLLVTDIVSIFCN